MVIFFNSLFMVTSVAGGEDKNGVASLMSTEKVVDSDDVSPLSLWTDYNFCE